MRPAVLRPYHRLSRRRFLAISAVLAGAAVAPKRAATAAPLRVWEGQALGTHATIRLVGDNGAADHAFAAVEAEIRRLEAVFSLYATGSEIARLNRDGRLDTPSADLVEVLSLARAVHHRTDGLFDPTVQPLFALHAEHFARPDADPAGPPPEAIEAALARVGLGHLTIDAARIGFDRPGMALTLNGIAQGHITDRVAMILRGLGYRDMLLDVGEIRALGHGPGGAWSVGYPAGNASGVLRRLRLTDRAVATSAPFGTVFDAAGRFGHIFDPARGFTGGMRSTVTVTAPTAAIADALSTAVVLMPDRALGAIGFDAEVCLA
jgi:thiamine biosynthesis lipoprotein